MSQGEETRPGRGFPVGAWSLVALAAGFGIGSFAHGPGAPLGAWTPILEPVGTLWMNALRVTVLPLVVCLMFGAVTRAPSGPAFGKLGLVSIVTFVGMLLLGAAFAIGTAVPILNAFPPDATGMWNQTALLGAVPETSQTSFADWVKSLIPSNAISAASQDQILPILLITLVFGLAVRQISSAGKDTLVNGFRAAGEAVLVVVRWILLAMPVGVFALGFRFAAETGLSGASAGAYFVVLLCVLLIVFTAVLYLVAATVGGAPLSRFAIATAPAQIVALSTRSSLAALPSTMEGARETLRLHPAVVGFVLPLAVSVFKVNRTVSSTVKLLFLAHLFGVPLDAPKMAAFVATTLLLSASTPGLPGGSRLTSLPAYLAAGLPLEGVMLFEAFDPIPDVFKTAANVTGNMAAATVAARFATPKEESAVSEAAAS